MNLTDVSPGMWVVYADPKYTFLGTSTNPRTGRWFALGDIARVTRAWSQGPVDFVELEGVYMSYYGFDLRAFRVAEPADFWADAASGKMFDEMTAGAGMGKSRLVRPDPKFVGPDQEVWVRERIETAILMGIAAFKQTRVSADSPAMTSAVNGIANGAAVEVIRTLGLKPGYVNLRPITGRPAPVDSSKPEAVPTEKPSLRPSVYDPRTGKTFGPGNPAVTATCGKCGRKRYRNGLYWNIDRLNCVEGCAGAGAASPRSGSGKHGA